MFLTWSVSSSMPIQTTSMKKINYGFIKPKQDGSHKVLGGAYIPGPVIFPDGHGWLPLQSPIEEQNKYGVESYNCSAYGTHDSVQPLMKQAKLLPEPDFAERYTGIIAGTQPPGNDPYAVLQAIKDGGMIPQMMLPFDNSVASTSDYFSFKGVIEAVCRAAARVWKVRYLLDGGWLWLGDIPLDQKQKIIMQSLQRSPVGASVYAWELGPNGFYVKGQGRDDNHWISIHDFVEGVKWIVRDSYPDGQGAELKDLDWNFDFGFAIGYSVRATGNTGTISARNPLAKVWGFVRGLFKK